MNIDLCKKDQKTAIERCNDSVCPGCACFTDVAYESKLNNSQMANCECGASWREHFDENVTNDYPFQVIVGVDIIRSPSTIEPSFILSESQVLLDYTLEYYRCFGTRIQCDKMVDGSYHVYINHKASGFYSLHRIFIICERLKKQLADKKASQDYATTCARYSVDNGSVHPHARKC
ncbi:MAG: hypothetical protein V3T17_13230 [Pseudomonadales bacterium]